MDETNELHTQVDSDHGVMTLRFARPERRNALTVTLTEALGVALKRARTEKSVRAVVLCGEGKGFCAGADLTSASAEAMEDPLRFFRKSAGSIHQVIVSMQRLPKPIVAAVNGAAAGAGFGLSLACDFRVGGPTTRFVPAFAPLGLSPDSGTSFHLPRLIGASRASYHLLLGEPIAAPLAFQYGLLDELADSDDEIIVRAVRLATRLAAMPAGVNARTKELVNGSFGVSLESHLEREREFVSECSTTPDFLEGVQSFFERRPPKFNQS